MTEWPGKHRSDTARSPESLLLQQLSKQLHAVISELSMSGVRRRFGKVFSETPSPSPSRDGTPDVGEEVQLVPLSKLKKLTTAKKSKRKSWLIFGLGGLFGLVVAVFFANQQEVIKLEGLLDVNLDSLMDVIPAGIVRDAKDLSVRILTSRDRTALIFEESRA